VSLSFKDLKPGCVYVTKFWQSLWVAGDSNKVMEIPAGTRYLVIEWVPSDWDHNPAEAKVYSVLIEGAMGTILVGEGDVLPMEGS